MLFYCYLRDPLDPTILEKESPPCCLYIGKPEPRFLQLSSKKAAAGAKDRGAGGGAGERSPEWSTANRTSAPCAPQPLFRETNSDISRVKSCMLRRLLAGAAVGAAARHSDACTQHGSSDQVPTTAAPQPSGPTTSAARIGSVAAPLMN